MPCPRCQAPLPRPGLVVCPICGCCAHWNAQAGTVDALRTPMVAVLAGLYNLLRAARWEAIVQGGEYGR